MWEDEPDVGTGSEAVLDYEASFYVMQIESSRRWREIGEAFRRSRPMPFPAAAVTTRVGLSAADAAALSELGFVWITECYESTGPQFNPDEQDFKIRQLVAEGLAVDIAELPVPYSQPAVGVYGGSTLADYPERDRYPGWSVWSAEYLWAA